MKDETWIDKIADKLIDIIDERIKKPGESYSTVAQVIKVDKTKGTAWVAIPGGNPETPAALSIDCKAGDTVQVYVSGHKATLTGNMTAPPTDDTTAIEVKEEVKRVGKTVDFYVTEQGVIKEEAENAQETADNAMTAANGKNKVYIQGTEPTGGNYIENDTWFDTAHDNKIYHYINGAWTPSLLGDDALDTFSANHIVAGSIDASQVTISNLDAANITSGYLNAARIETGSLSIAKTSGLQSELDDLDDAASDAATKATSYLKAESDGLKVGKNIGSADDYTWMKSDGFYVYQDGNKKSCFSSSGMNLFKYQDYLHPAVDVFDIEVDAGSNWTSGMMVSRYSSTNYAYCDLVANSFAGSGYAKLAYTRSGTTYSVTVTSNGTNISGPLTANGYSPFTTFIATGSTSNSVSSGSGGHITCTGTVPSGYIPIAIIKATTNHTFSGAISHMELTSNGAKLDIINSGSAQSFTGTAVILCTSIQSSTIV